MAASIADDDLLQRFIVTGYVVLPPNPSVPASVHADIASSVLACGFQASGRRTPYGLAMLDGDAAGNNLLHAAPALRGEPCLASPALHSALRVLIGRGYRFIAVRTCVSAGRNRQCGTSTRTRARRGRAAGSTSRTG